MRLPALSPPCAPLYGPGPELWPAVAARSRCRDPVMLKSAELRFADTGGRRASGPPTAGACRRSARSLRTARTASTPKAANISSDGPEANEEMDATHGSRPACNSQCSGSSRKSGVVGQRTMASGSHVQLDPSPPVTERLRMIASTKTIPASSGAVGVSSRPTRLLRRQVRPASSRCRLSRRWPALR